MGLFGISLDTSAFNKNDRIGATIALAQKILEKGGRANWLGLSFYMDPCPFISTFPTFPRTRVAGKALVRVAEGKYREASELMENEYPIAAALVPMPLGSMDDDGYFTFTTNARRITLCSAPEELDSNRTKPMHFTAIDGSSWECCDESVDSITELPSSYAVVLGFFNGYFPGASPAINDKNVRLMLVEEHNPGKSHIRSYFMLSGHSNVCKSFREWPQKQFSIGGPSVWNKQSILKEDPNEPLDEMTTVDQRLISNSPARRDEPVSLMAKTERKARWAIPQLTLEKYLTKESSS
ncbi:hypothetical protein QCA50_004858 [Cerrena zonata]|uniref:Uncharacterized protein n=1 Tax=Cerrena zonata TaxID=2478898 RepID=A0AAW0GJZ3_9APHY